MVTKNSFSTQRPVKVRVKGDTNMIAHHGTFSSNITYINYSELGTVN